MFKSTDVFLSLGRRGSGKSYLAQKIISPFPRKIIIDPLCEYDEPENTVYDFDEFSKKLIELHDQKEFRLIYQFSPESTNQTEEFNQLMRVLWYRGNILIHIEEVQIFSTPYDIPLWLKNALLTGRHQNIALSFTTQRPGSTHKMIISQANHIFCGSLHEKNDIEYVRHVLGNHAFTLRNIPERQFLYFQPGKNLRKINNDLKELTLIPDSNTIDTPTNC